MQAPVGHLIGKEKGLIGSFLGKDFGLPTVVSVSSYELTATDTDIASHLTDTDFLPIRWSNLDLSSRLVFKRGGS
jgi:hypothetical protein